MPNRNNTYAFPLAIPRTEAHRFSYGMTLRDWFAGQALTGILAGGFADTVPHDAVEDEAAFYAYKYADEMLAQRSK